MRRLVLWLDASVRHVYGIFVRSGADTASSLEKEAMNKRVMEPPRGILWDMDGVLADTAELHFRAWAQTVARYGYTFDREFFYATFGMNDDGILYKLMGPASSPEMRRLIGEEKESLFRSLIPRPLESPAGVREWLERFEQAGYRQAVASSAPPANIEAIIDALEARRYFDAIVSAHDMPGKPDPAVFLETARRLGIQPADALVIEDGLPGIEAARRAGMKCIAVGVTHSLEVLSGADMAVERLSELRWEDIEIIFGSKNFA